MMDKQVKLILEQCYKDAVELLKENMDDMHKVVAYLLEKETITGGEMVAIIQGRDPALVEDAYASTHSRQRPLPGDIEPPARNIHMVSESIPAPAPQEEDQGEQDSQKDETPADQPQTQPETPAQPQSAPEEKPEDNGRQDG